MKVNGIHCHLWMQPPFQNNVRTTESDVLQGAVLQRTDRLGPMLRISEKENLKPMALGLQGPLHPWMTPSELSTPPKCFREGVRYLCPCQLQSLPSCPSASMGCASQVKTHPATASCCLFWYLTHTKVKWRSLSRVQLFATPQTIQSVGFSRPEYWSGQPFPSPGDLPNPGIEPRSPALQVASLPAEPQGKPKNTGVGSMSLLQRIFRTQE